MPLATLILLSALAFPLQFPDPPMPPQFPTVKVGSCGLAGCECGCVEGGLCTCRPDGMKRLPATYGEWRAGLKRRHLPLAFPTTVVPIRMAAPFRAAPTISFGPSFGGGSFGACRGGG